MKRIIAAAGIILAAASLSACTPGERAVGGAVIGGGAGALIGGAIAGPRGAWVGAGVGAASGAIIGASARPVYEEGYYVEERPRRRAARGCRYGVYEDAYGNLYCR